MVEGLPGSGKSTTAHGLAQWLGGRGVAVEHFAEGRVDHPVDFEEVAVLTAADLDAIAAGSTEFVEALDGAAERHGDVWLVRHPLHPSLPAGLVELLRVHDAYDGDVPAGLHSRVLVESWRRFGETVPGPVQVWECVLLQNPGCALVARADETVDVLARHVTQLVETVRSHRPALVYLDAGDPAPTLERAATERPAEWLESVIAYHTTQGLGLRCGLEGFEGYVEFMRRRREMELEIVAGLDLPTLVVAVGDGCWSEHEASVRAFVSEHLDLAGRAPAEVA
ncbi:hypothetical protein FBY41_4220 [Humibacillus xanthopallidus]|uniref:Thymidylate kinase n=2 Tax=Humibacillus xanthopallidus TaxID=412689 RepID=A0A543HGE7_9MICO|nr:hypothetical protein FBY41_4220 [Humibacillus xanthopallidus]